MPNLLSPLPFLAAILSIFSSPLPAAEIAIPNSSFENSALPSQGGFLYDIAPWVLNSADSTQAFIERINGFSADGPNHLGLAEGAEVTAVLNETYQPDTVYTLRVKIGNRVGWTNGNNRSTYRLAYRVNQVSRTENAASWVVQGNFAEVPGLVLDTTETPEAVGELIRVKLASTGVSRSHFDDVRLEAAAKPVGLVTTKNDSGPGSLRQAIAETPDGGVIRFDPAVFNERENLIFLSGRISLFGRQLVIDASNIAGGVTLHGDRTFDLMWIRDQDGIRADVLLRSLTFRDGANLRGLGGALTIETSSARIENCTFDSNMSVGSGGGAFLARANVVLENCTFTGNSADVGAAIYVTFQQPSSTVIRHCTVTQNVGPAEGGAFRFESEVVATSNIFSGNSGSDLDAIGDGRMVTSDGNLIGEVADQFTRDRIEGNRNRFGLTDPVLAPLTWNGGTVQTHLPLAGSPARDEGATGPESPRFDARGLLRRIGTQADCGAVEAPLNFNLGSSPLPGFGPMADITQPGDEVSALPDFDSPAGETPAFAIDDTNAKYLNFFIENTGVDITPRLGMTTLGGFTVTSGNDEPDRDPASFQIIAQEFGKPDVLVAAGIIPPFTGRNTKQTFHFATVPSPARKYSVMFPSIDGPIDRGGGAGNSMQLAEFELLGAPADKGFRVLDFIDRPDTDPDWNNLTVVFKSTPGKTYGIELSPSLEQTSWIRWAQEIPSQGWVTRFPFADFTRDRFFHRVIEEE